MVTASILERHEWLRVLWEQASDAMALSDDTGIVLAANPAYYELYGYGPEEVLGKSFALIFPSDQRASAEALYRDVFRSELAPPVVQSTVASKGGSERVVESRVTFVEEGGRRTAMLSVIRDVSDEVAARRDAVRAQRELRGFLFSLSHDIKSPLSVIKGHAQLLRRQLSRGAEPSLERVTDTLGLIEASALRVAGLLDELVEVATIQEGNSVPLHLSELDVVSVVRETVDRHRRLADQHYFAVDAPAEPLRGVWDGPRLVRVLDNLLGNAIKYSPDGGVINVRVRAESRSHAVAVAGGASGEGNHCSSAGGGVLLSIEDDGIGISPDDLPHVFDHFHRGGNVPETVVGSGIGLTSVAQIVHQHGGKIHIASELGAGTSVTVWLPRGQPEPAETVE